MHQYLQEVEEVLSWLADKEATASSDDYGKDFEHLLVRLRQLVKGRQLVQGRQWTWHTLDPLPTPYEIATQSTQGPPFNLLCTVSCNRESTYH